MEFVGFVLGLVAVVGLWLLVSYNRFVEQRQLIADAWANVETELQRRYDLIPNLVRTVEGYVAHEREVLEAVTATRARAAANHGPPDEQARDENTFVGALRQLFAVSEGYPELKASRNFLALQRELVTTEDRIQAARRFYNGNVRDYNRRVQSVPSNVVAGAFSFAEERYFEVEEALARTVPTTAFPS